jgi:hypothetical protein
VLRANEHTDGGWDYSQAAGDPDALAAPSDVDMTGATMAALCVSGVPRTDPAVVAAASFLSGKLIADSGAFDSLYGVNTDSNGWAVSGLNACGIDPQGPKFTTSAGKTPVDFLLAQQFAPDGGFRYLPTDTAPDAYSSIDALRAVAGAGFTAAPPRPKTSGTPRWVASTAFSPGTTSDLALIVDDGSGTPGVCSVPVTPTGSTTTLGSVLDAAEAGATPGGCVTATVPSSGGGALTSVNGVSDSGCSTWKVSIDGGSASTARRDTVIHLGDTVSLHYDG